MVHFNNDWDIILSDEIHKEYYQMIREFLKIEYKTETVFPPADEIFTALKLTSYENTRVVILGQDPYHERGQAQGLAFSVNKGIPIPPSLANIYCELHNDIGIKIPESGDLSSWAKQGVLLLNATLTVREGEANSHKDIGWEQFTDEIIRKLNNSEKPVAFILWGAYARKKKKYLSNKKHLIIESVHPSPLSAYNGFFGSKPFSKVNEYLIKNNEKPIDWNSINNR